MLSGMQEGGFQDWMISADGPGEDLRNSSQPVPTIREDYHSASRFAGRDDKALKPWTIFAKKGRHRRRKLWDSA